MATHVIDEFLQTKVDTLTMRNILSRLYPYEKQLTLTWYEYHNVTNAKSHAVSIETNDGYTDIFTVTETDKYRARISVRPSTHDTTVAVIPSANEEVFYPLLKFMSGIREMCELDESR